MPSSDPERFANLELDLTWTEEEDKVILAPYDYTASNSGKELRTFIINAFNAWFELAPERLRVICDVVRLLHTSSLLIDDIQDNSLLRRGEPVAHSIYGMAQTINKANYVYFLAAAELRKLPNAAAALDVFNAEMLNLHRGQGQELFWRDTLTGAMVAAECDHLVKLLGVVFQAADDYKNLTEYTASKGYCEDLTGGKFSFHVVHNIRSNPTDQRLLHILALKTTDVQRKKQAVNYMESTGSLDYTKRVVSVLIQRAKNEVRRIDQGRDKGKGILQLLDKMALE